MNDLEDWFESRLGFLIEPAWPHLAAEFIDAAKIERRTLAHWLIKTAVTFNLAAMKGKMRIEFPPEVVANVREGVLPNYCWVDLGYSKLSTVGAAIGKCFRTVNGGQYQPSQIANGFAFHFIIQFNHLLLRVALAYGTEVIYDRELGGPPLRIYPVPDREESAVTEYQDLMKFEHSVVLKTWQGCQGNIPMTG